MWAVASWVGVVLTVSSICVCGRRAGYPFGSLVEFAVDSVGHPVFSMSPLAIHTRNVTSDPRCSVVVQMPGWNGLANARVTLFGDIYPVAEEDVVRASMQPAEMSIIFYCKTIFLKRGDGAQLIQQG